MADPKDLGQGRWEVRVFLGRDESTGRQVKKYRAFRADGIRRARQVARELEQEIREEHERGQVEPTATFADVVERWWEMWRQRDRSPSTRQGYRYLIDRHLLNAPMASKPVTELTVGDFDRWYLALTKS